MGLAQLLNKAEDAFSKFYAKNDKKLMNTDGTPKVFYHGTSGNFDEFRHGASGSDVRPNSGKGFYVTSDPEKAGWYGNNEIGGNVMPLHVSGEKMYEWPKYVNGVSTHPVYNRTTVLDDKLVNDLRAKGYQGIIGKRSPDEVIVFDANQLKSVFNKAPTNSTNIMRAAVPGGLAAELMREKQLRRLQAEDKPLENQLLGF